MRPPGVRCAGWSESVARRIVDEARGLTSALDAELWASQLLGVFWNQRNTLPLEEAASPDYSLILGEPLIEAVARLGGDGARTALTSSRSWTTASLACSREAGTEAGTGKGGAQLARHVGDAEITARR